MEQPQVRQHVTLIGWLVVLWGAFSLILGLGIFMLFFVIGMTAHDATAAGVLGALGSVASAGLLLLGAFPGLLAGWGLLTRQSWARILGIVVGVLMLPTVPFGTAVGIYAIAILVGDGAKQYFESPPADPAQAAA